MGWPPGIFEYLAILERGHIYFSEYMKAYPNGYIKGVKRGIYGPEKGCMGENLLLTKYEICLLYWVWWDCS